jgi:hypothetical protein
MLPDFVYQGCDVSHGLLNFLAQYLPLTGCHMFSKVMEELRTLVLVPPDRQRQVGEIRYNG